MTNSQAHIAWTNIRHTHQHIRKSKWNVFLKPVTFPHDKVLRELEDIKDKLFKFDSIRLCGPENVLYSIWATSNVKVTSKVTENQLIISYLTALPVARSVKGIFFLATWWGSCFSCFSHTRWERKFYRFCRKFTIASHAFIDFVIKV